MQRGFSRATGLNPVDAPTESELVRPLEGWMNWPSANEEGVPTSFSNCVMVFEGLISYSIPILYLNVIFLFDWLAG